MISRLGPLFGNFSIYVIIVSLETKTQTDTAVSSNRLESIFEVFVAKNVFHSAEKTQVEPFLVQFERVARRQVTSSIAFEAVNKRVKPRVAVYRCEIRTCGKEIEADPESLDTLRSDQCELVIGNSQR